VVTVYTFSCASLGALQARSHSTEWHTSAEQRPTTELTRL